jgi:hypothetical protein
MDLFSIIVELPDMVLSPFDIILPLPLSSIIAPYADLDPLVVAIPTKNRLANRIPDKLAAYRPSKRRIGFVIGAGQSGNIKRLFPNLFQIGMLEGGDMVELVMTTKALNRLQHLEVQTF